MNFTIPALFILGYDPTITEMVLWGAIGGLLGVCFMVPLPDGRGSDIVRGQ